MAAPRDGSAVPIPPASHAPFDHARPRLPQRGAARGDARSAAALAGCAPQRRPPRDPRAPPVAELAALGLGSTPTLQAFHPRFAPEDFAPVPTGDQTAEQARHGNPDLLLLTFGAIRPYKGVDIALEALARVDKDLDVRLVVAGRSWGSADGLAEHARRLALGDRVEFIDRFIPNEEVARLFTSSDAALLPYRSASQSGVVQLSFAYDRPVIASRVGGLPAAVERRRRRDPL